MPSGEVGGGRAPGRIDRQAANADQQPAVRPGDSQHAVPTDDRRSGAFLAGGVTDRGPLAYISPDLRPLAVPMSMLQPAPDNARRHRDADLAALADSLRRFGQRKPVVAMRHYRGLSGVVLAGNGTFEAAYRLDWSHLAVAWFEGTDDEARAYAIADNRTAELSSWDVEALRSLQADGVDLGDLWHGAADLADLLRADAPVPKFQPVEADHRLDRLQPHCRTCRCREETP